MTVCSYCGARAQLRLAAITVPVHNESFCSRWGGWGGDNGTALFRSKAESFNGEQSRAWHNSVHELKIETPPLTTEHM